MKNIVLISIFLCAVSFPAFSETHTIKFGDLPGGLEIQYEIKDSHNLIIGTMKNTSPAPIGCYRFSARFNGSRTGWSLGDDSRVLLDSGASQEFSWNKPSPRIMPNEKVAANKIDQWFGLECYTGFSNDYNNQSESKTFPWGNITVASTTLIGFSWDGFKISLENNSDQPIEIDWDGSSIVDFNKSTKQIMPKWVSPNDMKKPIANTVAPPRAVLNETITPKNYRACGMGGWCLTPLVPSTVAPELAEKTMKDYAGKKISLILQLIIEGKKTPVTFDFEVKSMKAIQPRMAPKGMMGG
jgi:hypothetical protein